MAKPQTWDFFISHAWEDKDRVARPLAEALRRRGFRVWYDEFSLKVGDSLRQSIDRGLAHSRHGIVVLSPAFFAKEWPNLELNGLVARQVSGGSLVIVPIWHDIDRDEILEHSPTLADRLGIKATRKMADVVERILDELGEAAMKVDISRVVPTGLRRLDVALQGGLPRRCSIVVRGSKGIGKTTFAMQVLIEGLKRGEPCLYVTYREAPHDIVQRMRALGAPVEQHIKQSRFRIFDSFSSLNGISGAELRKSLPASCRNGVVYVPEPRDVDAYYKLQCEVMDEIGFGGVNVIDSANERYAILSREDRAAISSKYFQRFRTKLARMGGQTAVHIVGDQIGQTFAKEITDYQDGAIRMYFKHIGGERHRFLQIESLRETGYDHRPLEFVITDAGIEVVSNARSKAKQ